MNDSPAERLPYRHACASASCGCGITRRDMLCLGALATASVAAPLLAAGDARAKSDRGGDVPVRIGYLPITDATPLLVAHGRGLFEAEGLRTEKPRMFRSWSQIVEAFIAGQVNVVHLLAPTTLWMRYGSKFPAKIVAWNHVNGSALAVAPEIDSVAALGGSTIAIPFWYSIHNIVLQQILRSEGLVAVSRPRGASPGPKEVNLVVMAPAEMVSALASKSVAGYIVAEPFVAAAESLGVGKVARFVGDAWKEHACCVATLSERDLVERPQWAQRVTNALVKAQLWARGNRSATVELLAAGGEHRYTPHKPPVLAKALVADDLAAYVASGVVEHPQWRQQRIDFQPYPFRSYTEELVRSLRETVLEGDASFLESLDPSFVADDLVDDRFVRDALAQVGGLEAFGIEGGAFSRQETISP